MDAATLGLPAVAGTSVAQGRFLNAATAREPVAVLGAATAQRLGIDRIRPGMRIWAGGQWFYVTGILNQDTYAPEIDSAVLVGFPAAREVPALRRAPVDRSTSAPSTPRPPPRGSTACSARRPTRKTPARSTSPSPRTRSPPRPTPRARSTPCSSGLGAVALLVGAIGVANIMVISVLERRSEIGLRRALGATRGQIRAQFLAEAILLSLAGGVIGVIAGAAATAAYARAHGETVVIPPEAWAGSAREPIGGMGALAGERFAYAGRRAYSRTCPLPARAHSSSTAFAAACGRSGSQRGPGRRWALDS